MIAAEDRTFDWQGRDDPENENYRVRQLTPTLPVRNWSWKRTLWLDQGAEGACTGFGLTHVLGTTPRRRDGLTNDFARQRYYRARQEDEWDGENYEGSSVLGAMKAANKDGLIKSYFWAKTTDEVLHAIAYLGPVEAGTNWYQGMDRLAPNGVGTVAGRVRGGHAYQLGGVNMARELVRIDNSWGMEWGINGSCYISFDDLDRLLREDGEFAVARKAVLS